LLIAAPGDGCWGWSEVTTTPVVTSFHPNSTGQQGYAYAVNYARTLYNNTGMARPAR
jgi:hypothetical protein